ncbi:hypothetical protein GF068_08580 [Polyangium spumosum]|uniref:Uncharacterized protein n=1 Tax=Polyangium spumosum TaxID=889282 RepID=A0A6N7PIZ3_9BACT|nr:hypothetical protein [Polyangium spumosum]
MTLTRDGAAEHVVREACGRIEAKTELSSGERADYLAVLWFVAEAEKVPTRLLKLYMSEERLMESELWLSAVAKGEARTQAETVIRILTRRLGGLEPTLQERIRGRADRETLATWYEAAIAVDDAEDAQRLVEVIRKASLP